MPPSVDKLPPSIDKRETRIYEQIFNVIPGNLFPTDRGYTSEWQQEKTDNETFIFTEKWEYQVGRHLRRTFSPFPAPTHSGSAIPERSPWDSCFPNSCLPGQFPQGEFPADSDRGSALPTPLSDFHYLVGA